MNNEETARILLDWYGDCRSCKYWDSPSARPIGRPYCCLNPDSSFYRHETCAPGHCEQWAAMSVETKTPEGNDDTLG